jgi:hypothetical protein
MKFYRLFTVFTICVWACVFPTYCQLKLNKIKGGILGVPGFQSGFATGNIGYERMNKNKTGSWQIHYNFSAGSIAADAGNTNRNWFTFEKTFYAKKRTNYPFMYSFFVEAGHRTKLPGFVHNAPDSIFKNTTATEICPGIAVGFHHDFNRHWEIQVLTGPKLIIDTKKESLYYNSVSDKYYFLPVEKDIRTGLRFMLNICYQF